MLFVILYMICGYQSARYLKRTLFGVQAEFTTNLIQFVWNGLVWGFILGWATIPLAIIVWIFHRR